VFDTLIESKRRADVKRGSTASVVSIILHSALVAGAVYATQRVVAAEEVTIDTAMVYLSEKQEEEKPEEQPQVMLDVPLKGFQTIVAPTEIPTDIPPVDLTETFDPRDYSGVGVEGGVASGVEPTSANQVYLESVVEEKPEPLSGPPLQYPELLRQAQIQGRVMVEAIIDTTGRAEPTSIKIVQSPHPGFDQPAKSYMRQALFRPARVHGRPVRVLVRLPIDFKLRQGR
jgi:protein TonB